MIKFGGEEIKILCEDFCDNNFIIDRLYSMSTRVLLCIILYK